MVLAAFAGIQLLLCETPYYLTLATASLWFLLFGYVLIRLGALPALTSLVTYDLMLFIPLTVDTKSWAFPPGAIALGAVVLIACLGFYTACFGGRSARIPAA